MKTSQALQVVRTMNENSSSSCSSVDGCTELLLRQIASTIVVERFEGCASVSVAQTSPEILWERQLFQFLPFGLSTAPPVFTKVIKQVMSFRLLCSSERRIWHMPELSLTRQWYLSIHSHRCEFVKNWNGKAIWHQYLR